MVSTTVNLCGIELANPVIPASGTFGYGHEFAEIYDINCLGAFSIKGTTREPRFGNPTPRIADAPAGMLNSVGLQNPGVEAVIARELPELKARVDVEPGRSIVAAAGVLLTQVEFIKRGRFGRSFAVVDASMTELLRPALYGAYHKIEEVETPEGPREVFDVVGSVCESTDCLGHGRSLAVKEGTLLALRTAGAYGMSMASNYNSRPLPMEVLVSGNRMTPLRRRQTEADLFADELLAGEARADAGVLRATLFKAMDIAQKI